MIPDCLWWVPVFVILFFFPLSLSSGFIQSYNANNISAVCTVSCTLSSKGFCFQSFEATGSKSALFHHEKPDLLCQWETICCAVSGPANNAFSVCSGVHKRAYILTYMHKHTHPPPPLICHVEDDLALGNTCFWKTKWRQSNKKILVQWEAPYATSSVFCPYFLLTSAVYFSGLNR